MVDWEFIRVSGLHLAELAAVAANRPSGNAAIEARIADTIAALHYEMRVHLAARAGGEE